MSGLRLALGIIFAIITIVFLILGRKYIISGNEIKAKIINYLVSITAIALDIFSLIIPGVQDLRLEAHGDKSQTIAAGEVTNSSFANEGSLALNITVGNNGILNMEGVTVGHNAEANEAMVSSGKDVSNDYEQVENFPVGWWDSAAGRQSFTLEEINSGLVIPPIVFNSISNGKIGHEFNFVGAKENTDISEAKQNVWNADIIEAIEGKTYLVRLYAHNNHIGGYSGVAENVKVRFQISPTAFVRHNDVSLDGFNSANGYYGVAVHGILSSSNSIPLEYGDGVKFVSNRPFHLEYIPGTAKLLNVVSENRGGFILSDDVVSEGVLIGYEELDGRIPGCFQYDSQTSIVVVPFFDD